MKKYNEIIEFYTEARKGCIKICNEQQKIVDDAQAKAEKIVAAVHDGLTKSLESMVSDWSSDDYDQFTSIAEHDDRANGRAILMISAAYADTHDDDIERVQNALCKSKFVSLLNENINTHGIANIVKFLDL